MLVCCWNAEEKKWLMRRFHQTRSKIFTPWQLFLRFFWSKTCEILSYIETKAIVDIWNYFKRYLQSSRLLLALHLKIKQKIYFVFANILENIWKIVKAKRGIAIFHTCLLLEFPLVMSSQGLLILLGSHFSTIIVFWYRYV